MMAFACPGSGFGGLGMMGYGWLFQLIIFAVFFIVVWWLLKSGSLTSKSMADQETPAQILKRRLASGEINKKEYDDLMREISRK